MELPIRPPEDRPAAVPNDLSGRSFCVIGGGVVGLSLARILRKRGGDVLLIEARRAGGGASSRAAGILPEPRGGRSPLERLTRGAHAGYERFVRDLERESGLAIELRPLGYADLALEAGEETRLLASLPGLAAAGSRARWLGREALRELAPGITSRARGALFSPGALWVNPPGLVDGLRRAAEVLGVAFLEGRSAALARSGQAGGFEVVLGGTGGERIAGREVLVAAGAWTSGILEALGTPPPARVVPIRGQMVEVEYPLQLSCVVNCRDVYVIPRPGGTAWVGATVEDAGFDEGVTETAVRWLIESARALLPELGARPIRSWAGLRPKLLRRGGPLLGEGNPPVLAGHYRSGIHLGPITAHLLASRLAGDAVPRVEPFVLDGGFSTRAC